MPITTRYGVASDLITANKMYFKIHLVGM